VRFERSVTSISWLPAQAVQGIVSLPFELGITRYDLPPPDRIDDLEKMAAQGAFRFANHLNAFIEVEDGQPVRWGHLGKGMISGSEVHFGPARLMFTPVLYPVLRPEPFREGDGVTFVQTAGGRTSLPSPRRIAGSNRVRLVAPPVWTTLSLTVFPDGTCTHRMTGASAIPRHWVYNEDGRLVEKSAVMDFSDWYSSPEEHTPWGGPDSPVMVVEVESDLERRLSGLIFKEPKVARRALREGDTLVSQGQAGTEIFLLLDGVLLVEIDGVEVAEVGPGAVVGEQAGLGSGLRNATLRAATPARVAVIPSTNLDHSDLEMLGLAHRRGADPPAS
jgi:hypothetical protein